MQRILLGALERLDRSFFRIASGSEDRSLRERPKRRLEDSRRVKGKRVGVDVIEVVIERSGVVRIEEGIEDSRLRDARWGRGLRVNRDPFWR